MRAPKLSYVLKLLKTPKMAVIVVEQFQKSGCISSNYENIP